MASYALTDSELAFAGLETDQIRIKHIALTEIAGRVGKDILRL